MTSSGLTIKMLATGKRQECFEPPANDQATLAKFVKTINALGSIHNLKTGAQHNERRETYPEKPLFTVPEIHPPHWVLAILADGWIDRYRYRQIDRKIDRYRSIDILIYIYI